MDFKNWADAVARLGLAESFACDEGEIKAVIGAETYQDIVDEMGLADYDVCRFWYTAAGGFVRAIVFVRVAIPRMPRRVTMILPSRYADGVPAVYSWWGEDAAEPVIAPLEADPNYSDDDDASLDGTQAQSRPLTPR